MKNKMLILIVLIQTIISCATLPDNYPKIEFIDNVDPVKLDHKKNHENEIIRFQNVGSDILRINKIKCIIPRNCSGMTMYVSKKTLNPGEKGKIIIPYGKRQPKSIRRNINCKIILETNDPNQKITEINVLGTIKNGIEIHPYDLHFGKINFDRDTENKYVTITGDFVDALEIKDIEIEFLKDYIDIEHIKPKQDNDDHKLRVRLKKGIPIDYVFSSKITVIPKDSNLSSGYFIVHAFPYEP